MGYRPCWGVLMSQRRHFLWVWKGAEPRRGVGASRGSGQEWWLRRTTARLDPGSCLQILPQAGPCAQSPCLSPKPECE